MHKLVSGLICAALVVNATASFAKNEQKEDGFSFPGGFLTPMLVVNYDGPILPRQNAALLITRRDVLSVKALNNIPVNVFYNNIRIIQLIPGQYTVALDYNDGLVHSTSLAMVNVDFQIGHVYLAEFLGDPKITFKHGVQGRWNPTITDITAELDEHENRDIDRVFKSGNRFRRTTDQARGVKGKDYRIP
jgi:hypothetical protein